MKNIFKNIVSLLEEQTKNANEINELREKIAAKITKEVEAGKIPKGKRIIIEKSLLKKLLFDKKGDKFLPVWSGDFLEYIDLGHIEFDENVLWDGEQIGKPIVYKNTNANIDFFDVKCIKKCDFSGTDLCFDLFEVPIISGCNLDKTRKFLTNANVLLKNIERGTIKNSSFQGDCLSIDRPLDLCIAVQSCNNFADTQVLFYFSDFPEGMSNEEKDEIKRKFLEMLEIDMFRGCYINGILVSDEKEQKALISTTLFENKKKENQKNIVEKTLHNIDLQVLSFVKKDC